MDETIDVDGAETRRSSGRPIRLAALLFLAYTSLVGQFQGIQNLLLPTAVERLAPTSKVPVLGALTTMAAVATIIAMFAGGWISDRTRSRWGRRTPSLVISALVAAIFSFMLGQADSIVALAVAMPLLWFATNYYQTALTAILPDRVAPEHRGFVAAAMALGVPIGILEGVNIAVFVPNPALGYALLNIIFLAATAALVLLAPERSSLNLPPQTAGGAIGGWMSAFRHRDFTLAFVSRFVLFLAYFTMITYFFYILQDYVGAARLPGGDVRTALAEVTGFKTLAWLAVTPVIGLIVDRVGHTAGVVGVISLVIGAIMLLPAISAEWHAIVLFTVLMGMAFGIYFAVDLKLVSMVLPSEETSGRDIGLMSIAGSGPTVIAPGLAAAIIHYANFPTLFATGAVLAVAGGLFAFPIRVRADVRRPPTLPFGAGKR